MNPDEYDQQVYAAMTPLFGAADTARNPCEIYLEATRQIDEQFLAEWAPDYYWHTENNNHVGAPQEVQENCSSCYNEVRHMMLQLERRLQERRERRRV
jgi:hypothetical protein